MKRAAHWSSWYGLRATTGNIKNKRAKSQRSISVTGGCIYSFAGFPFFLTSGSRKADGVKIKPDSLPGRQRSKIPLRKFAGTSAAWQSWMSFDTGRPMALRPCLSTGLPLSVYVCIIAQGSQIRFFAFARS
jgi:hypothetical protein